MNLEDWGSLHGLSPDQLEEIGQAAVDLVAVTGRSVAEVLEAIQAVITAPEGQGENQ